MGGEREEGMDMDLLRPLRGSGGMRVDRLRVEKRPYGERRFAPTLS